LPYLPRGKKRKPGRTNFGQYKRAGSEIQSSLRSVLLRFRLQFSARISPATFRELVSPFTRQQLPQLLSTAFPYHWLDFWSSKYEISWQPTKQQRLGTKLSLLVNYVLVQPKWKSAI